uniref:Serpin-like-4 protein n=1 Tax=Pagurus bernhardus TaxID=174397 RepID=W6MET4_PAGBR
MMHIRHKEYRMAYREDLQATMLAMEYMGSRLSMVFVLPDQREGLAGLEVKLSQMDLLSSLGQDMRTTKVEVTLPRFQLQEHLILW